MNRRQVTCGSVLGITIFLTACGGGGDSGGTGVQTPTTFPLGQYNELDLPAAGSTATRVGDTTGKITNQSFVNATVAETLTEVTTRQTDRVFENSVAVPIQVTRTKTNRSINGARLADSSSTYTNYYAKDNTTFIGQIGSTGTLAIVTKFAPYPANARSGDSGTRAELTLYNNINKQLIVGRGVETWSVESFKTDALGFTQEIVLVSVSTTYDTVGAVQGRSTTRRRLTTELFNPLSVKRLTTVTEDFVGAETGTLTTVWR